MTRFAPLVAASALALAAGACGNDSDAPEPRLRFVDVTAKAGIDGKVVCGDPRRWYIPESNGSGAAWLDFDGDGRMDLFVGNGCTMKYVDDGKRLEIVPGPGCRLYRNEGGWKFSDATERAGAACASWVNGIAVGDVDNDGDPDVYLANFGPDVFLRNDGGKFVDATKEAGLGNPLWAAAAVFGDADNDGDLDLYVANYCIFDPEHPPADGKRNKIDGVEVGWGPEKENPGINVGAPDRFYVNDGKGHFRDATREAGFELAKPLCSYAALFADVDGDGLVDLLVANDGQPSNLFHNLGKLRFKEEGEARGFAFAADGKPTSAMGLTAEDIDGDGDLDVFKTNFDLEPNSLYINDGKGFFTDEAAKFGLAAPSLDKLGWSCVFFDADNDGDFDLLVANGHVYPQSQQIHMSPWLEQSQLYEAVRGPGGALVYRDATASSGPGLAPARSSRGLAVADVDDDGMLDAVVIDLDAPPRLLHNESDPKGHFLTLGLIGKASNRTASTGTGSNRTASNGTGSSGTGSSGTVSNRDGYGAKVTLYAGGKKWFRESRAADGLYGSNDPRLHFAFGDLHAIDRVEIVWPSGVKQTISSPAIDQFLTIREP